MQLDWEPRIEHVAFGMLRLPEGKLSTRKGQVIFLEDVLDQAVEEARRIIAEKNPDLPNAGQIAEQVGIGAVVFNDLKRERVKDVAFDIGRGPVLRGRDRSLRPVHARPPGLDPAQGRGRRRRGGRGPGWTCWLEDAGHLILTRLARFPEVRALRGPGEPSPPRSRSGS